MEGCCIDEALQGRIQEFALGGPLPFLPPYPPLPFLSLPVPFLSPASPHIPLRSLCFPPLRSRTHLNSYKGLGSAREHKLPQLGPGRAPAQNEFCAL